MRKPKIAIVGIGLRLPGNLKTLDSYFKALENKSDLVKRVTDDRFKTDLFESSIENTKGHSTTFCAGVIDNIYNFDYKAFNLSKNEVESMDVQQRLCLMMTLDALSNANLSPKDIASTNTAVFIGAASTDMAMSKADDLPAISSYGMTGTNLSIISNRLSYYFDLHGPSMTIDTACSSSLVALDQAVNFIAANPDCMAITGGVNALLSPLPFIGFSQAHMLSPDGRCKVFDESANGYVRAEGGAILILKTLERALADNDHIIATIVDSKVNQDGRTTGISLPSDKSQQELLESLYKDKDLSRLVYVEAHGTGTLVGDPIEVGSIGRALGSKVAAEYKRPLYIGSAKSNLGHLETASGMAGLLKAIAILKNKKIPPSIHIKKLNPKIDFDTLGVQVVQEEQSLPKVSGSELIGINSFGFGGTNAHVIIEAYDDNRSTCVPTSKDDAKALNNTDKKADADALNVVLERFFKVSAASASALYNLVKAYDEQINEDNYKAVIATSYYTQTEFELCLYLKADNFEVLKTSIAEFLENKDSVSGANFELVSRLKNQAKSMFVFSGNGSQYVGMGRELLSASPVFGSLFGEVDKALLQYQDWSVIDYINQDAKLWDLADTKIVQPIVFAIEVVLCRYLELYGIKADGVCGHSVGEVAAAYCCKALTLNEACNVIVCRSKAQAKTYNMGDMAVVKIDKALLINIMQEGGFTDKVEIAAENTHKSFTLSGDKETLHSLVDTLKKDFGVGAKILSLNYPFHSFYMDVIKDDLLLDLGSLHDGQSQKIEYDFYTATKGLLRKGESLSRDYWWHNIRNQVKFADAIESALNDGFVNFVEIGPRDILLHYVKDIASTLGKSVNTLSFIAKKGAKLRHELCCALSSPMFVMTQAVFAKADIDRNLSLPLYPFDDIFVPSKISNENLGVFRYSYDELLGKKTPYESDCYINEFDLKRNPYFNDHIVFKECVLPAAALINIALTASLNIKDSSVVALDDFVIKSSTRFNEHDIVQLKTKVAGTALSIASKIYNDNGSFEEIVRATVAKATAMPVCTMSFADDNYCSLIDIDEFYKKALSFGIEYKNCFKSVLEIKRRDDMLYMRIDNKEHFNNSSKLNIYALDGILQSLFAFFDDSEGRSFDLMLPSLISKIRVNKDVSSSASISVCVRLNKINRYNAVVDCFVFNDKLECLMSMHGVRYIRFAQHGVKLDGLFANRVRTLRSLIDDTIDSTLADALKDKALSAAPGDDTLDKLSSHEDKVNYLNVLICLAIMSNVRVFDSYADVKSIFGIEQIIDDKEQERVALAVYLCDFLCAYNLAIKDEQGRYTIDRELEDADIDDVFSSLVRQYPECFAPAEIICRTACVIKALLEGDENIDTLFGFGKDNIYDSYFLQNEAVNDLSVTIASFVGDMVELYTQKDKVLRVLDINYKNDIVLDSLESSIASGKVEYILVVKDAEHKNLISGKYEYLRKLKVVALDELSALDDGSFDLLISNNALCDAAFASQFAALVSKLKAGAIIAGFDLKDNSYNNYICTLLSFADRYHDLRLNSDILHSLIENCAFKVAIENHVHHTTDNYDFYIKQIGCAASTLKDNSTAATLEQDNSSCSCVSYFDKNMAAEHLTVSASYKKAIADFIENTAVITDTNVCSIFKEGSRLYDLSSLYQDSCDLYRQRITYKGFAHRHVVFDFSSLEHIHDYRELGSLCERISKVMLSLASNDLPKSISILLPYCKELIETSDDHSISANVALSDQSQKMGQYDLYSQDILAFALLNLVRTIRNELSVDIRVLSVKDDDISYCHALLDLASSMQSFDSDNVNEVFINGCLRESVEFVYEDSTSDPTCQNLSYRLDFKQQGSIKSLSFVPEDLGELEDDEILIRNCAVGLNYRDVMWAMGLLPAEALENGYSGQSLGLECAGVAVKTGKAVEGVAVNDRVLAFTRHCFGNYVKAKVESVFKIPQNMSFNNAASLPVAFLTAYYSIVTKAQALKGESILIHGAAGGVGLAAVQLALDLGLEIYATAGTVHKRQMLQRIGVKHVYDSRSLDFAEQILKDTEGKGLDIVLNSLYKDGALASIRLLRPFGRFIELGKRDFFENNALNLKIFKDNLSFMGVDVDELLVYKKDLAIKQLNEVLEKFENGTYHPLFKSVYSALQVKKAFLDMKSSLHIGKIVVDFNGFVQKHDDIVKSSGSTCNTDSDALSTNEIAGHKSRSLSDSSEKRSGSYLITGGTGGMGLSLASYLIEKGAKHIYLTGRKTLTASIEQTLQALMAGGTCQVDYISLDVTDFKKVASFAQTIKSSGTRIDGFYHAAVQLHDAYLKDLGASDYELLIHTKADGAANILKAFASEEIPFAYTVLFSSITTVFGNEGQANYVAANAMVEAYAAKLRQYGHNIVALLLGPIGDVGLLKGNDKLLSIFESKLGLGALKARDVIESMHKALDYNDNYSICSIALDSIGTLNCIKESRFDTLCGQYGVAGVQSESSLVDTILNSPSDVAAQALTLRIVDLISSQLGVEADKINTSVNLIDLGIDSLSLMEIMAVLERDLKIKTSVAALSGRSTIEGIALYCVNKIKGTEDDSIVADLHRQHGLKQ